MYLSSKYDEVYSDVLCITINGLVGELVYIITIKNVEGCRDGSAKNYRKLGVEMAVFRQNVLYKDYTGIYSIPTSLFIPKIILHSVVMLRDYWEEQF